MRVTILDEFARNVDGNVDLEDAQDLLRRVITAYGDDSVQQLIAQHIVVEGASNLLTKKLEWGRLASYLEQSTRYIFFDQKDEHGKYKYYTPETLNESAITHYRDKLWNQIVPPLQHHINLQPLRLTSAPQCDEPVVQKNYSADECEQ